MLSGGGKPKAPSRPSRLLALLCLLPLILFAGGPSAPKALAQAASPAPSSSTPKSILLLYSAGYYLPAYRKNIAAFFSVMEKEGFPVNRLHFEHLDLIRHNSPEYRRQLLDMLRLKYGDKPIDLIITVEGLARDLVLRDGRNLFPKTPLLAILSADEIPATESSRPIVQIPSDLDMAGTLRVGLSLFPQTKRVFVVLGVGEDEQRWKRDAEHEFAPWADKVEFEYSSALTYEETLQRIGSLPPNTLVVYIALYKDKTGRSFVPRDVAVALTARANAPVFGVYDEITPLLVGGSMISYGAEGARAARLALDILGGKFPLAQPITTLPILTAPNLNWKQLERWGVSHLKLPEASIVINRPLSVWDEYKNDVILALLLMALQAGTIIALLEMRRRGKNAEMNRRKAEESYRLIVDTAGEGVWTIDQSHRTTFVNRKMAEMLGYTPEEMIGQLYEKFLLPEDLEAFHSSMESRRQGQAETYERRYLHKDGRWIWALVNAAPLMDKEGGFSGSFAMYTDITERKRAELALHKSEERYRQVVDNANEAIVVVQDRRIVFSNPKASAMAGYSSQEYLGAPFAHFIHPLDREMVVERHTKRLAGLPVPTRYDLRVVDKQGGVRWLRANVVGIQWEGASAVLCFMTDITEQRAAEQELTTSETKLRAVFDNSRDALVVAQEGVHVWVNPAYVRLFGYDAPQEVLGKSILEVIAPQARDQVRQNVRRRAIGEDVPAFYETTGLRRDGTQFHMEVNVSTYELHGKQNTLAVIRDIGERKRMEKALLDSEWFNRSLVEHIPQRIFVKDLESVYISCNANFARDQGIEPEEIAGATDFDFFPREMAEKFRADDRAVMVGGTAMTVEETYQRGQEIRWARTTKVAFRDGQGRVMGVLGIFDDITERKEAELALKKSEEKFRHLFRNAQVGMFRSMLDGSKILDVNDRFLEIVGRTREETVGLPSVNLWVDPLERQKMVEILLAEGQVSDFEHRMLNAKKGVRWCLASLRTYEGGVLEGSILDITDRKRAEEDKVKLEGQLRQAQKMEAIGTLAGGIAHDFNNILTAVLGFAEIAGEDARAGQADPADIDQIILSAQRAKELVKQILAFSRKQEPDLKPLSLNQVVTRVQGILGRTLPKMISIDMRLAEDLPPVLADPTQMEQVLLNLASNAADAMSEGGRLTLTTEQVILDHDYCLSHIEVRPGVYVRLTVSDTGQGMDATTREHIFEPFYTTKEIGKGTGLGLSSVYGIVKSHGGHIYCLSQPGQGTAFTVDLPALEGEELPKDKEASVASDQAPAKAATILVVDDEESLRRLGERTLSGHGYRVITAASGEEALQIYLSQGQTLDLVIMDLSMPGLGGHWAIKEILALNPQARVLISSGYAAQGQVKDSLDSGAVGFVAKPFRGADLLSAVAKALQADQP